MINEANEPSSACRLWRTNQVETSTPPDSAPLPSPNAPDLSSAIANPGQKPPGARTPPPAPVARGHPGKEKAKRTCVRLARFLVPLKTRLRVPGPARAGPGPGRD